MNSRTFFYDFGKLIYNIDSFYTIYAKKFKTKVNELWILYALNDKKEHTQVEISENWDIPKTTINTIIKDFESKDLVNLVQIKGEKRKLKIKLTEKGIKYAESILKELYELENKIYELLSFNKEELLEDLNEMKTKLQSLKEGDENGK